MKVNGHTGILGVLGCPVKHTLSPAIHDLLIEKFNLNFIYIPLEVSRNNFEKFIKGISRIDNFAGFNITVPYKNDVMKHLDEISKEAKLINAVNTVKIQNNKMYGYNTDDFGFIKSIELNYPKFKTAGKKVLMLGAGGASKAVAFALLKNKISKLIILNRTYKNGIKLRNALKMNFKHSDIIVEKLNFNYLNNARGSTQFHDLIINTTSIGLKKDDKILLDLKYLKGHNTLVYDLIYNPTKTGLLKKASAYGLPVLNGLDMLILQALKSFNIWTGIELENKLLKYIMPLRTKLRKML